MEGAAKLRLAIWLEKKTGLSLTGKPIVASEPKSDAALNRARNRETMASGIKQASAVLQMSPAMPGPWNLPVLRHAFEAIKDSGKDSGAARKTARSDGSGSKHNAAGPAVKMAQALPGVGPAGEQTAEQPQETLLRELTRAADGAAQIADGASRANREVTAILADPVGRRALDRLLIDERTVHDNPALLRSFAAYITSDGHRARIDLTQANRMFSHDAMDQVVTLRRRLNDYLGEYQGIHVTARIAGANAESADIRALHARRSGPELVHRADRRVSGADHGAAGSARVPQSGGDHGPDLCVRPGNDAPGFRDASGCRRAGLESAVFPVRSLDCSRCRLQRLFDGEAS